ncbi:MAG: hypothetical protein HYU86_06830 [Chloroflexi bacterium]|nr:hypothetical protein [Chloroflexota bacterium]
MKVQMIAEGAYFIPSYSEQTIVGFQLGITNQTVAIAETPEDGDKAPPIKERPFFAEEEIDLL